MTPLQNLHYAIGLIAYAIANVDGKIQKEERTKFHNIVAAEMRCKDYDFDISEIIFKVMDKDKIDSATAYEWAMNEIRLDSHYLSSKLKATFMKVIDKVAEAYPPVTKEEAEIIRKFRFDIFTIRGDKVFTHE